MDQLAQVFLVKLWHDPAQFRIVSETLCSVHDFTNQAPTDVRNLLPLTPMENLLQISHCRFGEDDVHLGHQLWRESGSGLFQGNLAACFQIVQAGDHGPHECALLLCDLEILKRLNNGNAATPAGDQGRTMNSGDMFNDLARIGLEVRQGDDIF
jgi:hypothetical protein